MLSFSDCKSHLSLFHRDALGKVSRLIGIVADRKRDMIGEHLKRNHREHRRKRGRTRRNQHRRRHLLLRAKRGEASDEKDVCTSGIDLMHGVHRLVCKLGIGDDRDHGRSAVDKRKRAVL